MIGALWLWCKGRWVIPRMDGIPDYFKDGTLWFTIQMSCYLACSACLPKRLYIWPMFFLY